LTVIDRHPSAWPASGKPRLGIGVTTYNRSASILDLIARLERFTSVEYDLVISDDGSTDGTPDILRGGDFTTIAGRNRGIAWNKNRGLFHLMNCAGSDIVLLMDDDVLPNSFGWEQEWIAASLEFGHVNFAPVHLRSHVLAGACRAADPGITHIVGGQCLGFTRSALLNVGYFDPRFGKYGHEHSDVSFRCLRAGFGGVRRETGPEPTAYFYVIDSGLALRDVPSNSDMECLERNGALLAAVANDPVYRLPWRSDAEMVAFLADFPDLSSAALPALSPAPGFNTEAYRQLYPDVQTAGTDPFAHYLAYGRNEGRRPG
jgi:glycosyltransferase involved in cell wall biosynthesis